MASRLRPFRLLTLFVVLAACKGGGEQAPPDDPNGFGPAIPVLEYLHVTLDPGPGSSAVEPPCKVLVNGIPLGRTSGLIEFEGGRCVITIERAEDYEPAEHVVVVEDTSALTPHQVVFTRRR